MNKARYKEPTIIKLEPHTSQKKGVLFSIEDYVIGMDIRRAFYITDFDKDCALNNRGNHSHVNSSQFIINIKGRVEIKLVNIIDLKEHNFLLDSPDMCLFLPPNYHIFMNHYSEDAVMLVVSDTTYEEDKIGNYFIPERLSGFREASAYLNKPLKKIIDQYNDLHHICSDRMKFKHLTDVEFRDKFSDIQPTAHELIQYYQETDNYILELTEYHSTHARHNLTMQAINRLLKYNVCQVLDFGCGVGEDSIQLLERGINSTLCDISGKTFDFAKWRVNQRGFSTEFIEIKSDSSSDLLEHQNFEAIICFEVLMHVPEPLETLDLLCSHLTPGGLFFLTHRFEGNYSLALKKNRHFANSINQSIEERGLSLLETVTVWEGKQLYVYQKTSN